MTIPSSGVLQQDGGSASRTLQWLRWADSDYLAARLLLLTGLVAQGAILSNTAIEKYLKSLFSHRDVRIPKTHHVSDLYTRIRADTTSDLSINESYLKLLQKAYRLRYPDELEEGFNIALNQVRLLAELDRTVKRVVERFRFAVNAKRIPLILERALQDQDRRILTNNVALFPENIEKLFGEPSRSFDLRIVNRVCMEAEYLSALAADEPEYQVPGLAAHSDRTFEFGYKPVVTPPQQS